jgi:hypothetical protein
VFKHGQLLSQAPATTQGAPVKPGLNPTMRGYSPSKLRWKQQNGQQQQQQQQFGQSNPNAYTRSTKHIPSYK